MKRRLSVTNFSLEKNLVTFRLNAPEELRGILPIFEISSQNQGRSPRDMLVLSTAVWWAQFQFLRASVYACMCLRTEN